MNFPLPLTVKIKGKYIFEKTVKINIDNEVGKEKIDWETKSKQKN